MISRAPRISRKQHSALLKCFSLDTTATTAAEIAKVNRHTADLWFRHWREVIFMHTRHAPRFSGEVEMDQAFFGGRSKKRVQSFIKQLAGLPVQQQRERAKKFKADNKKIQVFGIMRREGDVYTTVIKSAATNTLLPIIRLVVEQGSTIYSDAWRAFTDVGIDGYTHKSINHSEFYKTRKGHHINTIESFWSFAKRRLAKFNGISRATFPIHLKECEFRFNHEDITREIKKLSPY